MNLRESFIYNLKTIRKQNRISQLDLAIEIGKSANYINSIENGKYFPSPETIEKIADYLKIEPMLLFKRNDTPLQDINSSIPKYEYIEKQLKDNIVKEIHNAFNEIK